MNEQEKREKRYGFRRFRHEFAYCVAIHLQPLLLCVCVCMNEEKRERERKDTVFDGFVKKSHIVVVAIHLLLRVCVCVFSFDLF